MKAETRPPLLPDAVIGDYDLPHGVELVWRALTTPALLARWLAANDFEPRLGAKFKVEPGDSPTAECEVVEIESGRTLAFTWRIDGCAPSVVRFDLAATPQGSALRISHTGLPVALALGQPRRLQAPTPANSNQTRMQWAA